MEIELTLGGAGQLDNDEITDLIESVVDFLDRPDVEPSVSTRRVGDNLHITVGVTVGEHAGPLHELVEDLEDHVAILEHRLSGDMGEAAEQVFSAIEAEDVDELLPTTQGTVQAEL